MSVTNNASKEEQSIQYIYVLELTTLIVRHRRKTINTISMFWNWLLLTVRYCRRNNMFWNWLLECSVFYISRIIITGETTLRSSKNRSRERWSTKVAVQISCFLAQFCKVSSYMLLTMFSNAFVKIYSGNAL